MSFPVAPRQEQATYHGWTGESSMKQRLASREVRDCERRLCDSGQRATTEKCGQADDHESHESHETD
jgi:hypothetical protein